ncbi:hypothetical protein F5Y18DRAFT_383896 [Xylariaceae sp. FL1019]|nr:hypothetical protein F5Y18DRAFT_383896 [Xylariaceae sp. FL1019]
MDPLVWLLISFGIFYHAFQRPRGYFRQTLSICHVISLLGCLKSKSTLLIGQRLWCQFVVWAMAHTASLLLIQNKSIDLASMALSQRIRIIFRTWSNIRHLPLHERETTPRYNKHHFILQKAFRILALIFAQQLLSSASFRIFIAFRLDLYDFDPVKQGLIPSWDLKDSSIRAIVSTQWIWSTYIILHVAHDLLSLIFVVALSWDSPDDWPPLFGSVQEAYSLRRFWGVFWLRLHKAPFELFMPSLLHPRADSQSSPSEKSTAQRFSHPVFRRQSLRALWMFMLSALFHIAVDKVVLGQGNMLAEINFFLSNFGICLIETMAKASFAGRLSLLWSKTRALGYLWVFAIFFCLGPRWRYPLVMAELSQSISN